jgi:hypothetical protein
LLTWAATAAAREEVKKVANSLFSLALGLLFGLSAWNSTGAPESSNFAHGDPTALPLSTTFDHHPTVKFFTVNRKFEGLTPPAQAKMKSPTACVSD